MMFREIRAANVLGTVPRREHWALKILTPIHPTVHQPVAAAVVSLAPARMNLRVWSFDSAYPVCGCAVDRAKIVPATLPSVVSSGPPELPGRTVPRSERISRTTVSVP